MPPTVAPTTRDLLAVMPTAAKTLSGAPTERVLIAIRDNVVNPVILRLTTSVGITFKVRVLDPMFEPNGVEPNGVEPNPVGTGREPATLIALLTVRLIDATLVTPEPLFTLSVVETLRLIELPKPPNGIEPNGLEPKPVCWSIVPDKLRTLITERTTLGAILADKTK